MRILYDLLAVIFFMLFCFIGGSEEISILGNFVFGGLSFAACCMFVRFGNKCGEKQQYNGKYNNDDSDKVA